MQKAILFFTLLFYPLSIWAQGLQIPTMGHQKIKSAPRDYHSSRKSTHQRPWWAASNRDVLTAPCRAAVDVEKIERELKQMALLRRSQSVQVRKAHFTRGRTELIKAFKDLVTKYEIFGIEAEETEQIDIQKTFSINPHCQDVLCASKIIFGEERGPLILYLRYQYGMNASHLVTNNAAKANRQELLSFLQAMGDFPKHLFPLESNRQMIRFKRGYTLRIYDERTLANASMAFFDGWEDLGLEGQSGRKDYVVTHEVGHVLGQALELHERPSWLRLSGWKETEDGPQHAGEHHFISGYAMTNPREDFAETLSSYRYSPEVLQALQPEKYNFMKQHVFGGLEYIGESSCGAPEQSPLYRHLETLFGQAQNYTSAELKNLASKASAYYGNDFASYLSSKISKRQFLKSIQAGLAHQIFVQQDSTLNTFEKLSRARQLELILKNTDLSLLSDQQTQKIYEHTSQALVGLMAKALFERTYLYYTRDAQGPQELSEGCSEYAKYGIYSQELKGFLGSQEASYKLQQLTQQLKLKYCTELTEKLGPSVKPSSQEARRYAEEFLKL